jgi:hypothetical protein
MPMIAYEQINFSEDRRVLIHQANAILDEMKAQGYTLSLRQLYYQFVARDIIPNTERSYKNLGDLISKARMAGKIDWLAIEDRGRNLSSWLIEEDEQEVLDGIENGLALDYWARQNTYVEVWVEKDALSSVISRPCEQRRVPYLACKGYLSSSEAWVAGRRFRRMAAHGRRCILIHLGDHDPSGIDMTRDNSLRVDLFSGEDVEIRRIALNMDQIEQYNPPPNPAKLTDKRAEGYIARYGRSSWELDALEPRVIDELVSAELDSLIDPEVWNQTAGEETDRREVLSKFHTYFDDISDFVRRMEAGEED